MICLHQPDFTTTARALLGNDNGGSSRGIRINVQNHSYITGTGVATSMYVFFGPSPTGGDSAAATYTSFNTAAMHVNYVSFGESLTAGLAASINATTALGGAGKFLPFFNNTAFNTMGIGARNGQTGTGDYYQGTMSLMMIANRFISPTEYLNVYNLIKATIGKGLGLT